MNKTLPTIYLQLQRGEPSLTRPATALVFINQLVLTALALMLIAASALSGGASFTALLSATLLSALASFAGWRNVQLAQGISQITHTGNGHMLMLHMKGQGSSGLAIEADWLAFHRLSSLAWLKLNIPSDKPQRFWLSGLRNRTTIFIWQGTYWPEALKQDDPLREWARRWHTLSRMSYAPDFSPNN